MFACDVNKSALYEAFDTFRDSVVCIKMDVTNLDDISTAKQTVSQHLNGAPLFGLVNNAGIGASSKFASGLTEKDDKEMLTMFGVNVFGVVRVTNAFYPLMVRNDDKEVAGCIINVGSQAAFLPTTLFGYYSPTKAAVVSYSDVLRRELRYMRNTKYYVRVTCVNPYVDKKKLYQHD